MGWSHSRGTHEWTNSRQAHWLIPVEILESDAADSSAYIGYKGFIVRLFNRAAAVYLPQKLDDGKMPISIVPISQLKFD
jgi:hypothetical protein